MTRGWRVFGETLRLADREKVLLQSSGIGRILESLDRYPGIAPWTENELTFVTAITRGSTEPAGCNQIRRMGRLALANGNGIANVLGAAANRLQALTQGGQVAAEVHVVCTLAAGTGSGSVIDILAKIQQHLLNPPEKYNLYVHGFVTDRDLGAIDTGNFYANQYAALLELNAFRLAFYAPWDIERGGAEGRRRLAVPRPGETRGDLPATFKSVALISDITAGGRDLPLLQQIENAAEFLFQLAVRQMGDIPEPLRKALTQEDYAQYPADVNGGERSTAFIAYGVQRAAIPEQEIREKLSYTLARQFVLKVLYHNWDERYRETPRSFARDGFVDARRGLWYCTREHLWLNLVGQVHGEGEFPDYETDWRDEVARERERERVRALGDAVATRRAWLDDLDRRLENYWERGFRSRGEGGGANDYFRIRRDPQELRQRARGLRAVIEGDLLTNLERLNPEYPLHHLPAAMEFLVKRIEDDRLWFANQVLEARRQLEEAERLRADMRSEYAACGRLARGKQERIFQNYRDIVVRSYYWRTIVLAAEYAHEFGSVLIVELRGLLEQVSLFDTRFKLLAANFADEIAARIQTERPETQGADTLYLVDAGFINDCIKNRFENDGSVQDRHADKLMAAIKALRGDRHQFAAYLESMPVGESDRVGGTLVDEVRRISESNAVEAHRKAREDDADFVGIFGGNIVHKLYQDFGGQADLLKDWLRELIERSMPMIAFDAQEKMEDLPGAPGPVLRRCVFVPRCQSVPAEFTQQLRQQSHAPPLPDLMKADLREVRRGHLPSVLLATALDLMVVPGEDGEPILFGNQDAYGRVTPAIDSGLKPTPDLRTAANESAERFGQPIPLGVVILQQQYLERFSEGSLREVSDLVEQKIREQRAVDLAAVERRLNAISGQCFLLGGRRETDETYRTFERASGDALDRARRLGDRSSL